MAEQRTSVRFRVPATHPCLAGHFPGNPVVPAVVVLEMAAQAAQSFFPQHALHAILGAKFMRPLQPGEEATLDLHADCATGRVRFSCRAHGQLASRGELRFGDDTHVA